MENEQLLKKIAFALNGIAIVDMTKAEQKIVNVLMEASFLEVKKGEFDIQVKAPNPFGEVKS